MNIEHQIRTLLKRMSFLGYQDLHLREIISDAIGQCNWVKNNYEHNVKILLALKKYERLGSHYLLSYSK